MWDRTSRRDPSADARSGAPGRTAGSRHVSQSQAAFQTTDSGRGSWRCSRDCARRAASSRTSRSPTTGRRSYSVCVSPSPGRRRSRSCSASAGCRLRPRRWSRRRATGRSRASRSSTRHQSRAGRARPRCRQSEPRRRQARRRSWRLVLGRWSQSRRPPSGPPSR